MANTRNNNKKPKERNTEERKNKDNKKNSNKAINKSKNGKVSSRKRPVPTGRKVQKKTSKLKIIPLGGLGEIGKNMTVFEYENDIILIDASNTVVL